MFDFPHPLGPTIPVTSWSKWTTVRSTSDLKPEISSFLIYMMWTDVNGPWVSFDDVTYMVLPLLLPVLRSERKAFERSDSGWTLDRMSRKTHREACVAAD